MDKEKIQHEMKKLSYHALKEKEKKKKKKLIKEQYDLSVKLRTNK